MRKVFLILGMLLYLTSFGQVVVEPQNGVVIKGADGNKTVVNASGQLKVVLDGRVDDNNSTAAPLAGDGIFTGYATSTLDYALIFVSVKSDVASATDGLVLQQSSDSTNWDLDDSFTIPLATGKTFSFQPSAEYFRVKYTNGGTIQGYMRLQTILKKTNSKPSSHRIQDAIIGDDDAELVKAVLTGLAPDGAFKNVLVTNSGNQKISIEEFESGVSSNSNSQLNVTPYFSDGTEYLQVNAKQSVVTTQKGWAVAENEFPLISSVYKFGSNPDVGVAEETIWTDGGLYNWTGVDAAAGIVKVSSTSTDDVLTTGTGAWTCTIYGLSSADSTEISESVNLNGQNAVNSGLSYYRVNRIVVNTAGTGLKNAGKIYAGTGVVSTGTPAVKWAVVDVGRNQTLMAVWTVPIDKTLYVTSFLASTNSNKGDDLNIYVRPPNELFQIKSRNFLYSSNISHVLDFALPIQGGTDIDCRAVGVATGAGISFSFEGWYE